MRINSPQSNIEKIDPVNSVGFVEKVLHGLGDVVEIVKERRGAVLVILMCAIGSAALTGCEKKASGGGREGRPMSAELKKSLEWDALIEEIDNEMIEKAAAEKAVTEKAAAEKAAAEKAAAEKGAAEKAAAEKAAAEESKKHVKYSIMGGVGYYYYVDVDGNNIFGDTKYNFAAPFSEEIALVKIWGTLYSKSRSSDYYYAFINKDGENIFGDVIFDNATSFSGGIAVVSDGQKYFYINKKGEGVFGNRVFVKAEPFYDGLAIVRERGVGAYFGNRDGVGSYFMNKKGENAFGEVLYEEANRFSEGFAAVYDGGKWYYIDRNGKKAFSGMPFSEAHDFKAGFAKVVKGIRPCVIDKQGNEVSKNAPAPPPGKTFPAPNVTEEAVVPKKPSSKLSFEQPPI